MNQPSSPSGKKAPAAFTLIELLVVIAIIAILAAMLMPALAKAKFASEVTACTSNYKQWAVACSVYATDNQGSYPSFTVGAQPGENVTDVAANFITNMAPYGMQIPFYFCPARASANNVFAADNARYRAATHRDILTLNDLSQYYVLPTVNIYGDYIILDGILIWVPRTEAEKNYYPWCNGLSDPNNNYDPESCYNTNDVALGGWPLKMSDPQASKQPVVSDYCLAGGNIRTNGTYAALDPTSGHPYRGKVVSVNVGYADGHVETHALFNINWHMVGNGGEETWFY
jgi:prepilin-type N-terminal cleavage/methylation domain-containing protein/prepilin-type processing-associated H-X9-DG protein